VCSPATVVLTSRACRACPSGTMAGSARRPAAVRRSTMQRTGRIATGELHRIGTPWLALRWLEFIRRLSALSLSTTGSTTACWSSLSGPISTNGPVLQSLPSHTRKVTGSIPVGTTRNVEVSSCLVGWPPLAIAFIRQNPPWVDLPLDYLKVCRGTGTAPHSTCGHRRRPETVESGMGDGGGGVVVNELGDETRRHCRGG